MTKICQMVSYLFVKLDTSAVKPKTSLFDSFKKVMSAN